MDIYDCFMYFDEDLLLDIRLNTLHKHIKKFIIAEAIKKNLNLILINLVNSKIKSYI